MKVREVLAVVPQKTGATVYAYRRAKDAGEGNAMYEIYADSTEESDRDKLESLLDATIVRLDATHSEIRARVVIG